MDEAVLNQLLRDHSDQERELQEIRSKIADLQSRICIIEEGGMVQE